MGLLSTTDDWKAALAAWEGIQNAPAPRNRGRLEGFKALENGFLERYLATSHWFMPAVWFAPIVAYCVWASFAHHGLSWAQVAACFALGALAWTLLEYCLHRFVFHFPPVRPLRPLLFVLHGYHHEFPNDPDRLVAPPILSWPIGALVALLYWSLFGAYWQAMLAGTFTGYLAYDWTHYYTHHAVPRTRFGRFMRRFHLEHHFRDATSQFGLSSPLWDLALGSWGEGRREAEVEPAAREEGRGASGASRRSRAGRAQRDPSERTSAR